MHVYISSHLLNTKTPFILLLLIALSYLIDREIKKMKDSDVDSDIKDNEIEEISDDTEDECAS